MPRGTWIRTEEVLKRMSEAQKGKKHSQATKDKISKANKGKKKPEGFNIGRKHSEETKRKIGKANAIALKGKRYGIGRQNKNYKSTPNELFRKSTDYKIWRKAVFERDDYTCQGEGCGKRGGDLEADHIKPFAYFPELRLIVSNGRTLCKPCHKTTSTYSRRYKHNENT